jgi:hypothetical protein
MRWEDERYVRVYTRDTVDWQGFSFDAQALFLMLLRKVDRAGLLDLGKPGKRGVAVAVGHPREWARLEPALEELLTDGCVRLVDEGRRLLVPNFLSAQEAKSSDKARQQKSREVARDAAALQDVMQRDSASHGVTESHTRSHGVTGGHTTSQPVTPSRAVPCCAVPSRAERSDAASPVSAPTAAEQRPLVDVTPTPPKPKRPPTPVAQWAEEANERRKALIPPDAPQELGLKQGQWPVLGEALKAHGALTLTSAFTLFLADAYARERNFPVGLFVGQVARWVGEAQAQAARARVGGGDKPRLGPRIDSPAATFNPDRPRL